MASCAAKPLPRRSGPWQKVGGDFSPPGSLEERLRFAEPKDDPSCESTWVFLKIAGQLAIKTAHVLRL